MAGFSPGVDLLVVVSKGFEPLQPFGSLVLAKRAITGLWQLTVGDQNNHKVTGRSKNFRVFASGSMPEAALRP